MRRRLLGSIAALAAGAGSAWAQDPAPLVPTGGPPAVVSRVGDVIPAQGGGPTLMPPIAVGPATDPLGLGPTATLGPPPGPMYPPPGPYGAPLYQPAPPGGPGGAGALGGYGTAPKWWVNGGYSLNFVTDQPIPYPILTTSAPNQSGVLGQPSTIQLISNENIKFRAISGFRLGAGFFGDADRRFGFEMNTFYTERQGYGRTFASTTDIPGLSSVGIPLLARPYTDSTTGAQTSLVLGTAALGSAYFNLDTRTQNWGIDAAGVWNVYRSAPTDKLWSSVDLLGGYKFWNLRETLDMGSAVGLSAVTITPITRPGPFGVPVQIGIRITPIAVPVGGVNTGSPATVSIVDRFSVTNRFNGGFVGIRHEVRYGMFSLTTTGRVGLGLMHQVLDISGGTTFINTQTGTTGAAYGGLYANASNIGRYDNDEFGVIPEMSMTLGINLTKQLTMYAGYSFLYANRVARPGNQLNPVIDSTTVPFSPNYGNLGSTPAVQRLFVQDDFWTHSLNFGFQFRY